MRRARTLSFGEILANRLGVKETDLYDELEARLGSLLDTVSGDAPADSAEVATAYGDLWALGWLVDDARRELAIREAQS
ncbi:hypothetical protein EV643_121159 [Kribbella sp. VKM Ac-2527]|uniref:Uncharacterized protein n=1 Tax=Kribbella caucasensis TaxID=2512215 RepID=A0A4R6JIC7_9ACTN|nr:hypothetical protein [Kribbella sp. VKM Ac-2527]TDO35884.1 hypothetical protein EV643_121159 [Kribbella sp. VKM Ac-2527]